MDATSLSPMQERIVQALADAQSPQTARQLCDALRRQRTQIREPEVVDQLRRLQQQQLVRIDGSRWRLLTSTATTSRGWVTSKAEAQTHTDGRQRDSRNSSRDRLPQLSPQAARITSRWATFRRLCRYYIDCVTEEESPNLRAFVENQDDTWVVLSGIPWDRFVRGDRVRIALRKGQAALERNRVRRGEDHGLYLGYPVQLARPANNPGFLTPLFVQPVGAAWKGGGLEVSITSEVRANSAWIDYRFPNRADREAFLRAMGFLSSVEEIESDDEFIGQPTSIQVRDITSIARDGAKYIHDGKHFAEDIQPLVLSTTTVWRTAKPGLYNAAILMIAPQLRYVRGLIRELREISERFSDEDLDGTALAQAFPNDPPRSTSQLSPTATTPPVREESGKTASVGETFGPGDIAQRRLLYTSQRDAVRNALSRLSAVVTGPPGTGKSEVVAAILLNQMIRRKATLFASKNHQALDAVVPRLNGIREGAQLMIRASARELAERQDYLSRMQDLLARPSRVDVETGEKLLGQLATAMGRQRAAINVVERRVELSREYERINAGFAETLDSLPAASRSCFDPGRWPREVSPEWISVRERKLCDVLGSTSIWHRLVRRLLPRRAQAKQAEITGNLRALPTPFSDREVPAVEASGKLWLEFLAAWKKWAMAAQQADEIARIESLIRELPSASESESSHLSIQKAIEEATTGWMEWAAAGLPWALTPENREDLANLRAGLKTWGAQRFRKELNCQFPLFLQAFPLWSVSNLSARSALPLAPSIFDLTIIDEASQCDIASVIPLLFRSRRALFVGDPMQLAHVSKLEASAHKTLLEKHALVEAKVQRFAYPGNSAFDLFNSSAAIPDEARVRLDLHFRSHPGIAEYCNETFYSKTLHVVTQSERLVLPAGKNAGIHWTNVEGELEPGVTGVRSPSEVIAIVDELRRLAKSGYGGTIGIVTPFRHQMIRLKDAVEASDDIPPEFRERARLSVATAHGLQGDERDLILFSLCAGPSLPAGSLAFLRDNPNLFNVAISRARAVLHVFGDEKWAESCGIPFIEKLVRRVRSPFEPQTIGDPFQSPWEKILFEALAIAGIPTTPQYPIAGRFLDLAVVKPVRIDIEVDGEHHRTAGGGRNDDDHWRDLQLRSLGWKICRFWVYELREDLDRCVERVRRLTILP